MAGAGLYPAGSGPFGVGTPITSVDPTGIVYRDPSTGESLSGRRIDPKTRDYTYDTNGRALGLTTAQQLVYLALTTTRASSCVASLGQRFATIDRITSTVRREADAIAREALADLVARKVIEVIAVTVDLLTNKRGIFVRVQWRDLQTGREETTSL